MAKFDDLIAAIREGDGGYPDSFLDDASTAYADDMGSASSKIELLEAENAQLQQRNLELAAANYDLINAGRVEPGADPGDEDEPNEDEPYEDSPSIDDLFNEH